jgi:hypothetical protein
MRNFGIAAFLFGLVSFGFLSCSSDSDAEWRDQNLSFFDNLKNYSDIHVIGDSVNGYPGIYYKVLKDTTGVIPIIGDSVNVYYAGWIINDTIAYDDSLSLDDAFGYNVAKGYGFVVGSSNVIDGWNLAIQVMPVGSKWRIYIPYYLGYGTSGYSTIPAYSTLIFDITLRKIVAEN